MVRERKGGRSQAEYARYLGIGQSTLSMILARKIPLRRSVAARISQVYPDLSLAIAQHLLRDDSSTAA